ncbi:hypothetical protein EZV62_017707 [Acer yangbiense]|uniref:Uncharacterized protein n=1 Tax=Acer yangbiense TaxID=1000413 RepID=A0A5C7HHM3_9ROSI|nr:hypothetical protein EZV62_017707 [Acer yangbiense]
MKLMVSIIKLSSLSLTTLTLRTTPVELPIAAAGRNQVAASRRKAAANNAVDVMLPSTRISSSGSQLMLTEPAASEELGRRGSKKLYSNLNYQPENDDDDVNKRASDFVTNIREKWNRNGISH